MAANDRSTAPRSTPLNDAVREASDVDTEILRGHCDDWRGSRANLEAEGLIPPDFEWPEGYSTVWWEALGLRCSLGRRRPPGSKGCQREADWWVLRRERRDANYLTIAVHEKQVEIARMLRSESAAGRAEWNRYWLAHEDERFQAFKAIFIPPRKKPGRPRKAV